MSLFLRRGCQLPSLCVAVHRVYLCPERTAEETGAIGRRRQVPGYCSRPAKAEAEGPVLEWYVLHRLLAIANAN
jgi:hypothetical protein